MARSYFGTDLIKILGLHIILAFSHLLSSLGIYRRIKREVILDYYKVNYITLNLQLLLISCIL